MSGRIVLTLLVGIHWILPFTPVNLHEETRIVVASVGLGAAFLTLLIWSLTQAARAFAAALGLLVLVIAVSATTGASPLLEGAQIKLLFLVGLSLAVVKARVRAVPEHSIRPHGSRGCRRSG